MTMDVRSTLVEDLLHSNSPSHLLPASSEAGSIPKNAEEFNSERLLIKEKTESIEPVLSPAHRLPLEIIDQIFSCLPVPGQQERYSARFVPGLWHVGWVCRQWREVVLANPLFWSNITVICSSKWKESIALALEECLFRSQNAKLKVTFRAPLPEDDDVYFTRHLFLELLKHAHRWQEALLTLSKDTLSQLHAIQGRVPLLEKVSIELRDFSHGDLLLSDLHTFDVFKLSPSLYSIRLANFRSQPTLDLPWNQIRTFHFSFSANSGHSSSLPSLLEKLCNVEHFVYESSPTFLTPSPPIPPPFTETVVLSDLRSLGVAHTPPLEGLHLPSLVNLTVNGRYDSAIDDTLISLCGLIRQSSCTLTHLSLGGKHIVPSPAFVQLLLCVPNLEHLSITDRSRHFEHILLPLLGKNQPEFGDDVDSVFIPHLHTLQIESSFFEIEDVDHIQSFIHSRRGLPLETIHLALHLYIAHPDDEASMNSALDALKKSGANGNEVKVVIDQRKEFILFLDLFLDLCVVSPRNYKEQVEIRNSFTRFMVEETDRGAEILLTGKKKSNRKQKRGSCG